MSFNSFRFTDKAMEVTMITECKNILLSVLLLAHTYYSFKYMLCCPMWPFLCPRLFLSLFPFHNIQDIVSHLMSLSLWYHQIACLYVLVIHSSRPV
jgi:hypothetical protein